MAGTSQVAIMVGAGVGASVGVEGSAGVKNGFNNSSTLMSVLNLL